VCKASAPWQLDTFAMWASSGHNRWKRTAISFLAPESYLPSMGKGRSELNGSQTIFQLPSDCFLQTVSHLPRSFFGLPVLWINQGQTTLC
jgi:hypothetical protein